MYQSVIFYLFCICISLISLLELWKYYLSKTILKNYGTVKGYPIVGILPKIFNLDNEKSTALLHHLCNSTKIKPFYLWAFHLLFCFIDDPDDFKTVLSSKQTLNKGFFYDSFNLGSSLLTLSIEPWKLHRRALNPTMSPRMISSYLPIFNEKCKIMVNRLKKNVGSSICMKLCSKQQANQFFDRVGA